jgi:uncharacterized membrane protein YhhN
MDNKSTILFAALALFYCIFSLNTDLMLDWLIKILPILLLLGLVINHAKLSGSFTGLKMLIGALTFSMAGDIFLAVDRQNLFIFGLGAFFVGHCFYILAFRPMNLLNRTMAAALIAYGTAVFNWMSPQLGALFIPVLAYLSIIMAMAIMAWSSVKKNKWLVLGAMSFVISDSLIGIDKFVSPIPYAGLAIMVTYYLAQYSLVRGMLTYQAKHA